MRSDEQKVTPCPWCGTSIPVSRQAFPGPGAEGPFLQCRCGAVGVATLEPEMGRLHAAEAVLGMSRRLWANHAWGLEKVEWRVLEGWNRLHKLEELASGPEVWVALVWGRRK